MAPGLPDLAAVRAVCAAVSKPVHFMVGIKGKSFTAAGLTAAGVKRGQVSDDTKSVIKTPRPPTSRHSVMSRTCCSRSARISSTHRGSSALNVRLTG